jgi:hypothetical protein
MRLTRPAIRAPTAAIRSASNVTVPVTLTSGAKLLFSAGAKVISARCA